MNNKKQLIHYCTIMSEEQWNFLMDEKSSVDRFKCLYRLMSNAVRTKTAYGIKGIDIVLEVGQVAASDVELAAYLGCNRKTVGKLIDRLNRLGMLTTRTNNRTSIHSLHFLTGWYADGVLTTNPHYIKPSAAKPRQTDNMRTPKSEDETLGDSQGGIYEVCHSEKPQADSGETDTTLISSSLCLSETPDLIDEEQGCDFYPPTSLFAEDKMSESHATISNDSPHEDTEGKGIAGTQDVSSDSVANQ